MCEVHCERESGGNTLLHANAIGIVMEGKEEGTGRGSDFHLSH